MDQNKLIEQINEHIGFFTIQHGSKFVDVFGFVEFLQDSIEREFNVIDIFVDSNGKEIGRTKAKETFCAHLTEQCELPNEPIQHTNHYKRRRGGVAGIKRGPYKKSVPKTPEEIEKIVIPKKEKPIPYWQLKPIPKKIEKSLNVEVSGPGIPSMMFQQNDPESILNDNMEFPEDDEEF